MQKHVLIVEDDPFVLELAVMHLQNAGFKVSTIRDGEEALLFLETNQVDALVLDQDLPHVLGTTILSHMSKSPIPVVLYTNSSTLPDGFTETPTRKFLFKAITNGDDLVEAVQQVIGAST